MGSGAAGCTTSADSRRNLPLPPTPTIAQTVSPIGKQAGPRRRRGGAAHTMVRVVLVRDARQSAPPLLLLIAMRASPIGLLAGALRKSNGAARTQEKDAHSRAEVVLEEFSSVADIPRRAGYGLGAGAYAPSSGACRPCLVGPCTERHSLACMG